MKKQYPHTSVAIPSIGSYQITLGWKWICLCHKWTGVINKRIYISYNFVTGMKTREYKVYPFSIMKVNMPFCLKNKEVKQVYQVKKKNG